MTTLTLQYDSHNSLLNTLVSAMLQAGAKVVEPQAKTTSQVNDFDIVAEHLFGKRETGKYTEKELFLINSKINASKCFAKYL